MAAALSQAAGRGFGADGRTLTLTGAGAIHTHSCPPPERWGCIAGYGARDS